MASTKRVHVLQVRVVTDESDTTYKTIVRVVSALQDAGIKGEVGVNESSIYQYAIYQEEIPE